MRIKLAILDRDKNYLDKIVDVFGKKYADKFEIYSFTEPELAIKTLSDMRVDVLLASNVFELNVKNLPKRCAFAYFVESPDIDMINDQRTICKFQKLDLIYKQILSLYSETAGEITGMKIDNGNCITIAFAAPAGGVGASTMAAACALHFAAKGKRTLYLNIEKFGSSEMFFFGEGQFGMSDIIFALKSKRANLSMKLESCVKQDNRGVYFYSQSKLALDMMELGTKEILLLISELKLTGSYDYIILDTDFALDEETFNIYRKSHYLLLVGDGSNISNYKIQRAYNSLLTIEQGDESGYLSKRTALIYNKFSSKTSRMIENIDLRNIGGAPKYENASIQQILYQISTSNVFDVLGS